MKIQLFYLFGFGQICTNNAPSIGQYWSHELFGQNGYSSPGRLPKCKFVFFNILRIGLRRNTNAYNFNGSNSVWRIQIFRIWNPRLRNLSGKKRGSDSLEDYNRDKVCWYLLTGLLTHRQTGFEPRKLCALLFFVEFYQYAEYFLKNRIYTWEPSLVSWVARRITVTRTWRYLFICSHSAQKSIDQ